MEIIIHDKNAFHHFMDERKVLWELLTKRTRKSLLIQFGIGILFTIIGFSPIINTVNKTEYVNNITHQNETIYEHSSFNLVGAIGIVYIILVSGSLFRQFRHKEALLDEASLRGKRFFKQFNETTVAIIDENISYESPVVKNIYRWEVFTSFSLYKNYIFLNIDKYGANAFTINKQLLSEELYLELMNFIKRKLQEKKI